MGYSTGLLFEENTINIAYSSFCSSTCVELYSTSYSIKPFSVFLITSTFVIKRISENEQLGQLIRILR